jgi:hypothetical protein
MKTPKEKAKDLVDEYKYLYDDDGKFYLHASLNIAKRYAIIAVDEIISINNIKPYMISGLILEYYKEVKQEIELL